MRTRLRPPAMRVPLTIIALVVWGGCNPRNDPDDPSEPISEIRRVRREVSSGVGSPKPMQIRGLHSGAFDSDEALTVFTRYADFANTTFSRIAEVAYGLQGGWQWAGLNPHCNIPVNVPVFLAQPVSSGSQRIQPFTIEAGGTIYRTRPEGLSFVVANGTSAGNPAVILFPDIYYWDPSAGPQGQGMEFVLRGAAAPGPTNPDRDLEGTVWINANYVRSSQRSQPHLWRSTILTHELVHLIARVKHGLLGLPGEWHVFINLLSPPGEPFALNSWNGSEQQPQVGPEVWEREEQFVPIQTTISGVAQSQCLAMRADSLGYLGG